MPFLPRPIVGHAFLTSFLAGVSGERTVALYAVFILQIGSFRFLENTPGLCVANSSPVSSRCTFNRKMFQKPSLKQPCELSPLQ